MSKMYQTLISADALAERLTQGAPTRLFDCRARLGEPDRGAALFAAGHIEGALHADLDIHLADKPGVQEGTLTPLRYLAGPSPSLGTDR